MKISIMESHFLVFPNLATDSDNSSYITDLAAEFRESSSIGNYSNNQEIEKIESEIYNFGFLSSSSPFDNPSTHPFTGGG